MTQSPTTRLPKSKFPWCLRCDKRVETLTVQPHRAGSVIVEYQCHGETVSQEMKASEFGGGQGLASYTAFNAYTSGLMLGEQADKGVKKAAKKGGKQ